MSRILLSVHDVIWGTPLLLLILGTGLWITVKSGCPQLLLFPRAMAESCRKLRWRQDNNGVSPFRALCTALGATVGTGNIVGVAGAICLGGPGSVFWMWICGILAMGTKYAEATLAVRFRVGFSGGPMYMITEGMGSRWRSLAVAYSIFGIIASFGVGNAAQVNAVISGINSIVVRQGVSETLRRNLAIGLIFSVAVGYVLLGGTGRIGAAAEILVPFASLFYIGLCLTVLALRWHLIPEAVFSIFRSAFAPQAVTGGAVGSVIQTLRIGCCRGVFTNEAGMGTASIAHGSAAVSHPAEQGLMGLVEVFLDTIVLCSLTALVILVSGVNIPFGMDAGGTLTIDALSSVCGDWVSIALTVALGLFAFAAVLGWSFYGTRCTQFLFGQKAWEAFAAAQTIAVVLGAMLNTKTIWLLSELFNGLMAIPNLLVLAVLSPELSRLTKEYKKEVRRNFRRRR